MDKQCCGGVVIVLVDDELGIRDAIELVLEEEGYFVLTAGGGTAALDLIKSSDQPVDMVLSDIRMPEGDGIELLRKIRAGEAGTGSTTPVILMTGFSYYSEKDLMALGANRVISKPFSVDFLIKVISETFASQQKPTPET